MLGLVLVNSLGCGRLLVQRRSKLTQFLTVLQLLVEAHRSDKRIVLVGTCCISHLNNLALVVPDQLKQILNFVLSCAATFHGGPKAALSTSQGVDQLNCVRCLLSLCHEVVLLLDLFILRTSARIGRPEACCCARILGLVQ